MDDLNIILMLILPKYNFFLMNILYINLKLTQFVNITITLAICKELSCDVTQRVDMDLHGVMKCGIHSTMHIYYNIDEVAVLLEDDVIIIMG